MDQRSKRQSKSRRKRVVLISPQEIQLKLEASELDRQRLEGRIWQQTTYNNGSEKAYQKVIDVMKQREEEERKDFEARAKEMEENSQRRIDGMNQQEETVKVEHDETREASLEELKSKIRAEALQEAERNDHARRELEARIKLEMEKLSAEREELQRQKEEAQKNERLEKARRAIEEINTEIPEENRNSQATQQHTTSGRTYQPRENPEGPMEPPLGPRKILITCITPQHLTMAISNGMYTGGTFIERVPNALRTQREPIFRLCIIQPKGQVIQQQQPHQKREMKGQGPTQTLKRGWDGHRSDSAAQMVMVTEISMPSIPI
ncbi:hypothetical protein GGR54DRAFT_653724 [Hypoxylon sp. NC1633]|nr:hypothetical protein GGR54DRAFT_653724 [Hypoxylon sp. NC1633]